eukprot:574766-Ditylum_brightwellii.AAC.2
MMGYAGHPAVVWHMPLVAVFVVVANVQEVMATESLLMMLLLGATAAVVGPIPCYMSHISMGHSFENAQTYVPDTEETPNLEFVYSALLMCFYLLRIQEVFLEVVC